MSFWSEWKERFRTLVFRGREDAELNEEVDFHLEMEAKQLEEGGLSPEEARRRARLEFGGGDRIKEEVRDARGTGWLDRALQDVRYAFRSLRHHRTFATVAIAVLGLGIGANTATFTLVNGLLLSSLSVQDPDRLVMIGDPIMVRALRSGLPGTDLASYPVFQDVRAGTKTLSAVYATGRTGTMDVVIGDGTVPAGEPEQPRTRFVSEAFFSVLGIPAFRGRVFGAAEDAGPGASPVAVISHRYWQLRFQESPSAVGRSISINGSPVTIVGVTPPGFTGDLVGHPVDIWVPLTMQPVLLPNRPWLTDRQMSWLLMMGRLAPGGTLPQARGELQALVARSLTDHAQADEAAALTRDVREAPAPVASGARGFSSARYTFGPTLTFLSAAVALVLLVVCANVANLMLARGIARRQEMSVRLSLGAGRGRVVQQLMIESTIIAVAGATLGLLIARVGSAALLAMASQSGGAELGLRTGLDARVLGFAALLTLVTVALFGVIPAVRTTRVELAAALRASSRSTIGEGGRPGRMGMSKLLVAAQVAISTLLLVATGMMVRSVARLTAADLGLDRDRLVIAELDLNRGGFSGARLAELRQAITARLGRVPGVEAVAMSENGVFSGTESMTTTDVEGFTATTAEDSSLYYDAISAGYFRTLGARILSGRELDERDRPGAAKVAVINESLAKFFFAGRNPIGHHLSTDGESYQIIGVVADVNSRSVRAGAGRRFYLSLDQMGDDAPARFKVEIRTATPEAVLAAARRTMVEVDPNVRVTSIDPLDDLVADSIRGNRLAARVVTLFGGLGLGLAALGLYGVLAYTTIRRTNEFGLRMALGATSSGVARLVIGEALGVVAMGAVIGVPGAIGLTWVLREMWYGIAPLDWPSIGLAIAALLLSAVLAAYLPAARAGRISPLESLRSE